MNQELEKTQFIDLKEVKKNFNAPIIMPPAPFAQDNIKPCHMERNFMGHSTLSIEGSAKNNHALQMPGN
jgi:hypothetical protein